MGTPVNAEIYERTLHLARAVHRHTIQRGSSDRKAVKALQERLSELGYAIEADGLFGEDTEAALKKFQDEHGAQSDGIVGEETLGKLTRATGRPGGDNPADPAIDAIAEVVAPGSTTGTPRRPTGAPSRSGRAEGSDGGSKAKEGPEKGPHGGNIDPRTGAERATATTGPIGSTEVSTPTNFSFEEQHPRDETGKFAQKGDSGEHVANTQKALNEADQAELAEDGEFGPRTAMAVRRFQQKHRLAVDGVVGPETSGALRRLLKLRGRRRVT